MPFNFQLYTSRPDFNIEKCVRCPRAGLFEENEEYRQNKAEKSCEVVPLEALSLEDEEHDDAEYRQGDYFLNDFQLQKVEGSSVQGIADTVGRYCEAILEESYPPRKQDNQYQRPSCRYFHFAEFKMPVPSEGHEDVRQHQHQYRYYSFHGAKILQISLCYLSKPGNWIIFASSRFTMI